MDRLLPILLSMVDWYSMSDFHTLRLFIPAATCPAGHSASSANHSDFLQPSSNVTLQLASSVSSMERRNPNNQTTQTMG
eukprot:scaffold123565_cov14-Prasinocladus_malaysianus.AAC.1